MAGDTKKHILLAQSKAFHTLDETMKLCETFVSMHKTTGSEFFLSAPYTYIDPISKKFTPDGIQVGADCMLAVDEGGFTTSIAGKMVKEAPANFVLIGTTEERQFITDKEHTLNNKVKAALQVNVTPFICLEDTEHEYHDGKSKEVLTAQLKESTHGLTPEELKGLHIVYDAAWINKSPWSAASKEITNACNTFYDVVNEVFDPEVVKDLILIAPIPAYSPDLPEIVASLQASHPFHGYSFGILDASVQFTTPLYKPTIAAEPAPTPKPKAKPKSPKDTPSTHD